MTREQVVAALGEPDCKGCFRRRSRLPGIYVYGDIELHFLPWRAGGLFLAYQEDEEHNGINLRDYLGDGVAANGPDSSKTSE